MDTNDYHIKIKPLDGKNTVMTGFATKDGYQIFVFHHSPVYYAIYRLSTIPTSWGEDYTHCWTCLSRGAFASVLAEWQKIN